MRAIPKALLIHTIALHTKEHEDRWGNGNLDAGTTLSCVRMEPSSKIIRDKNNAEIQLSATLFYDCRNSCPRNMKFVKDNIVSFNGEKYRIETIEPLYDRKRLHHYEMGLVKGG